MAANTKAYITTNDFLKADEIYVQYDKFEAK